MKVPFSPPDIGEEEIREVESVLRSGWITTGPRAKELERLLAEYLHTEKAVCLSSQTAAAEMTLRLLGIGPGDEVILPAYTYTATCSVVCHVGATPVLVDCAPGSFEMDYDRMESAITAKTKAIVPVDLGGVPCHYERIFAAAKGKQGLFCSASPLQEAFGRAIIVADSSHALGAQRGGKMCGEIADFTTFSFHAVKNVTTAEGGAVTWRAAPGLKGEELYRQYMLFSLHGQTRDALAKARPGEWDYDIAAPYYKCNLPDVLAAIGLAQLRRYPQALKRRHQLIRRYDEGLSGFPLEPLRHIGEGFCSSGHLYLTRLRGRAGVGRDCFLKRMAKAGIACNVHYKPLPLLTAYKNMGFDIGDFPNAYEMYQNEASLPLYAAMTDETADYVTEQARAALAAMG
ncbi:MAG: DegT/DnrJ/EryC1/StrS family aminotransferase [Oscillospiraceae bacterium]|nr:DegT/DnrJ/EryC1/StrS family aminotransferase [Oscillospiraceae bacterium]